ncbi:MAG: hypothetical protein GQF41_1840 [Candidatus Rifleibacterium amylolyticum]|nr:MAG: hypothetical protein GQF41_1840 [Candidatus Rifleibacterium amylolyticum]
MWPEFIQAFKYCAVVGLYAFEIGYSGFYHDAEVSPGVISR